MSSDTFPVVIGDWSGDGHEKTDTLFISVPRSLPLADHLESYLERGRINGRIVEDFCNEYEDSVVPADFIRALAECAIMAGIEPGEDSFLANFEDSVEDGGVSVDTYDYLELWVTQVNLGIQRAGDSGKVSIEDSPVQRKIHIGGYGLFW